MAFASVYPLYIQKAEKKSRTKEEVDEIIYWLTGYNKKTLQLQIDKKTDFETFFNQAPLINPNVSKITGLICGYRVEEIEDKIIQQVRYLDKLIDELAKGKSMEKILRKYSVFYRHHPGNLQYCQFHSYSKCVISPHLYSIARPFPHFITFRQPVCIIERSMIT